jgi:TonB-linked SusC/RagA family outer membrane protein
MKKLILSLFMFMLVAVAAMAQNRTLTGTVTGRADRLPLPGVSVTVTGTSIGAQTNASGRFTISVPASAQTLTFSSVGYAPQQVAIGSGSVINASLAESANTLGEVVVTGALGITRTRNQQAYAAQQIGGEETSKTRNSNFITGLSGKIAGLEVRQNNGIGGSTNTILRGTKSIFGSNQALFVVDGVPYDNSSVSTTTQASGGGGYDYGNPATDINPDDIESVTVLKGPNGSALYGSRGANGVILITTKKAKRGLGITVNSSVSFGSVDKSTLPKYQNEYGGGYGSAYGDNDYFLHRDINGDGVQDLVVPLDADGSLGARFDPNLLVYQSDAFDPFSPNFGKATPWVAAANGVETFFVKPVSNNQSIFITNGGDQGSFKLGYTRNDENGYMPNSNVLKNALDFSASYNVTPKLTASAAINMTRTDGKGRYGSGYQSDNIMNSFRQWFQTNVDLKEQKDRYFGSGGQNATWNPTSPTNTRAIFWDNPYFIRYQNYETDSRNRYFGNTSLNYKVLPWLNVLGRVTVDNYNQIQEERRQVGSTGISNYTRRNIGYNETNFDFLASADKNLSEDFNLKGVLGYNYRRQRNTGINATTNGGLVVPGVYALANSVSAVLTPTETDRTRQVTGTFASATVTYKNMLVLDGTIRRDVSSTLPDANNTYYYPSVNLGFTFSELLKQYSWLSYGKIRGGYANVGNDTDPYRTFDTYSFGTPFGGATQASVSTTKNNALLKPEQNQSLEGGLEMAFFNNRLGFDVTYYKSKLVDQIIPVVVSTATGYNSFILNSGTIQNKGLEATLFGTPIRTQNFSWRMNVNFTRNRNKVIDLFKDASGNQSTNLQVSSFQGGLSLNATLGQPLGTFRGRDFVYLNGQKVVGDDGYYLQTSSTNNTIGDVNPKWIGGINNTFTYKNFSLSFLIDMKKGGSVFSLDTYYGMDTGLYPETAGLNDLGNPSRDPVTNDAKSGGVIFPGVNANGQPNTVRADNTGDAGSSAFGYGHNPQKAFVYDAGYIKLREAVFTYGLPKTFISKIGNGAVKGIDLGVSGRNLWIIHKNVPYSDPEEGLAFGNLQGYQSGALPTLRTFTFNVKLTF